MDNIDKLKAVLPALDTLTTLRPNGTNKLCGACPKCGGDDRFFLNVSEQKAYCNRDCKDKGFNGGDIINWHGWLKYDCIDNKEAISLLLKEYGISGTKTASKEKKDNQTEWDTLKSDDKVINYLVNNRKLSPDIVQKAINDGFLKYKYYCNKNALAIGYKSLIDLAEKEKVYAVQYVCMEGKFFETDKNNKRLFGGAAIGQDGFIQSGKSFYDTDTLIITEAVINALSGAMVLPEYCWLSFGSSDWTKKADLLKEHSNRFNKIIVFGDNDKAGIDFLNKIYEILKEKVYQIEWSKDDPEKYDVNDLIKAGKHDQIKEMVAGAKLFKPIKPKKSKPEVIKSDSPNQDIIKIPTITLQVGLQNKILNQAQEILLNDGCIYQKNSMLYRINKEIKPDSTSWNLKPITKQWLMNKLNAICQFVSIKSDGDIMQKDCPYWLPESIIANSDNWNFPYIAGIRTTPTLRKDGTILNKVGYDLETGIYLAIDDDWNIPDNPTRDDALKAYGNLEYVIQHYKFSNPESKTAAIAGMLTGTIIDVLPVSPAFAIDSPIKGSGKSKLGKTICYFADIDTIPSSMGNEDESEKILASLLRQGKNSIFFDNVIRTITGGELLNILLTEGKVSIRIFGLTEVFTINKPPIIVFTGCNPDFSGDITRRILKIRIDPKCSNPEEKRFPFSPDTYTKQNIKHLITSALTILRAYHVAGCPDQNINEYGSFEDWSKIVRGSIVWLGKTDPYLTVKSIQALDTVKNNLSALLESWYLNYNTQFKSIKQVANDIETKFNSKTLTDNQEYLIDTITDIIDDKKISINKGLAKFINKHIDRVEGNYRFIKSDTKPHNVWCYKIELIDLAEEKKSIQPTLCDICTNQTSCPEFDIQLTKCNEFEPMR